MTKPLFDFTTQEETAERKPAVLSTKQRRQQTLLAEHRDTIEDVWPAIEKGRDYHFATATQWSTHDLVFHLLRQTGPAHLTGATWSMSVFAASQLIERAQNGEILSLSFLFDWRVQVRCPEAMQLAKFNFADLRVASCHAKVFVLRNDDWQLSCVSSANFTNNPRIECGFLSTDPAAADFHEKWIRDELKGAKPFGIDSRKLGKQDGRT